MFKLSQSETYSWPVQFKLPADGGQFESHTFDAVFKRISKSRINEASNDETMTDIDFAKEVLVGWKGVTNDGKEEVPFSESARDRLLEIPAVAAGVVASFLASSHGKEAKRKNL